MLGVILTCFIDKLYLRIEIIDWEMWGSLI